MKKEQIFAFIKALKDYNIFDKDIQNNEISQILVNYVRCNNCPIKKECYAEIGAKPDYIKFCFEMFYKMVKGVK